MKSTHLLAASLSVLALGASASFAQDANKPMVQTSPMTGMSTIVVPKAATMSDMYMAHWVFYNLDDREVKRFHSMGYSDSSIKMAANIAMRSNVDIDYVLRVHSISAEPFEDIALMEGVPTYYLMHEIPGYGASSLSVAPPMSGGMMMPPPMMPSSMTMPATSTTSSAVMSAPTQGTIVDIAMGNPDLSTLVAAIKAANLVDALSGPGPFTVFAPSNEAFAKLPPGTLDNLLKPENQGMLKSVLTYHVMTGKVMASDVMAMTNPSMPTTLNGATLTVKTTAPVMVNNANVTQTDIVASNGVIHVIDTVLMPPAMPAPAAP